MDLSLQLQQKQVLSQRMQQSVEILQMHALALSEYAKELAEENPLLEWTEDVLQAEERGEKLLQKLEWLQEADEQNRGYYHIEQETAEREEADSRFGKKEAQSLREYLLFQINILKIPEDHKKVLRFLAESTAESGYLEADAVESLIERYHLKEKTAARILEQFQSLDPAGVGARDLKECLLIQLRQKETSELACRIVEQHLEELAKNRLSYLAKQCRVTVEEVTRALQEIRACAPKPGSGFRGEEPVGYIVPDILVEQKNGELSVSVNRSATPHLQISASYVRMLREGTGAETTEYISEKLKQAEWALQCISKRENTLQQTAECIVERQKAFFLHKDGQLLPLKLADVAEKLQLHESTVSRAVKEKYLQCERGIFPLHAFFSKAMAAEGEETVSADSIRRRIRELIAREDKKKPLSDRELTEKLTAEGIQISRRTVAKYRESMEIPGAAGRKVYKG